MPRYLHAQLHIAQAREYFPYAFHTFKPICDQDTSYCYTNHSTPVLKVLFVLRYHSFRRVSRRVVQYFEGVTLSVVTVLARYSVLKKISL